MRRVVWYVLGRWYDLRADRAVDACIAEFRRSERLRRSAEKFFRRLGLTGKGETE